MERNRIDKTEKIQGNLAAREPNPYYIQDKDLDWRNADHWRIAGSGRFSLRNWYDFKEMVQIAKSKRTIQTAPAP